MSTNRQPSEIRAIEITQGFSKHAPAVLFRMGETIVHCTAFLEEGAPRFVPEGQGWVTAEYAMLPASGQERIRRSRNGRVDGRSQEIQRLIGRSFRGVMDLEALGPHTIYLDCDVLNADGGTRCASISGAYVALSMAIQQLKQKELIAKDAQVLREEVAAVSLGLVDQQLVLDLEYAQDVRAEVDLNLVMTGRGELIEIQGTGERSTFSVGQLQEMLTLGQQGIEQILTHTRTFLQSL
ncbi:MAG: ribonuclease PH [Myxococcota bacterium]